MNESYPIRDRLIPLWVLVSGVVCYSSLAYAVYQSHSEQIVSLVNRISAGGV